jgi:DNA-binding Lrp family transcriptional regulator
LVSVTLRVRSQDVRHVGGGDGVELDDVDRALLRELADEARMTNQELATRVGIAPSTCLGRVRALRERGVIRGFHTDIDPEAVGRSLQAMVSIRMHADARQRMNEFVTEARAMREVLDIYFVAGAADYLLHVATANTMQLRDLVAALNSHPTVAGTETSLIFEHVRGRGGASP